MNFVATRDVANTKSDYVRRHAVPMTDHEELSRWYAQETRIFAARWEGGRWVKGNAYFVNEVVFDIDAYDERTEQERLHALTGLLGQPRAVIRNRQNLEDAVLAHWCKREDGTINRPKPYGVQVVYQLDQSVRSDTPALMGLLDRARLAVTRMVHADPNFHNHMFKCYWNTTLFDVQWNLNATLSLKDLVVAAGMSSQELVDALSAPKYVSSETMHPACALAGQRLADWYDRLNTYGGIADKSSGEQTLEIGTMDSHGETYKHDNASRNVTLFNWLRLTEWVELAAIHADQNWLPSETLFESCDDHNPLPLSEVRKTVESVFNWRVKNGYGGEGGNGQVRRSATKKSRDVFHFERKPADPSFRWDKLYRKGYVGPWEYAEVNGKKEIIFCGGPGRYQCTDDVTFLTQLVMSMGFFDVVGNLRSVFNRYGLMVMNDYLQVQLPLLELEGKLRAALFRAHWLTHAVATGRIYDGYALRAHEFKELVEWRAKQKVTRTEEKAAQQARFAGRKLGYEPGLSSLGKRKSELYARVNETMRRVWERAKADGWTRVPPVSWFQQLFHCRNTEANLYHGLLIYWLKVQAVLQTKNGDTSHFDGLINNLTFDCGNHDINFSIRKRYSYKPYFYYDGFMIDDVCTLCCLHGGCGYVKNTNSIVSNGALFYMKRNNGDTITHGGENMLHLVLDTETNGFVYSQHSVISIGSKYWDDVSDKTEEQYLVLNWWLLDKGWKLQKDALDVHGLTKETIEQEGEHPLFAMSHMWQAMKRFAQESGKGRFDVFVAHNSPFDLNMLRSTLTGLLQVIQNGGIKLTPELQPAYMDCMALNDFLTRSGLEEGNAPLVIDTVTLDRIMHYEVDGVKVRHDLESIGLRYGLGANEHAHDAMYDTRRLFDIWKILLSELKEQGVPLNSALEGRLVRKWDRLKEQYGKKRNGNETYLALNPEPLVVHTDVT